MADFAKLSFTDKSTELPILVGSEGEIGLDITHLRADTGAISFDDGYGNTGSCQSAITFIDGDKGILRYRGYDIGELSEQSTFLETAYLIIYGELPNATQLEKFNRSISKNVFVPENMKHFFEGYPSYSHPMAILSAMMNSLGCFFPDMASNKRPQDLLHFDRAAAFIISKVRTIAALTYRMKNRLPTIYPKSSLGYCDNFFHMLFSDPYEVYEAPDAVKRALDLILILHADHEQNCSTSTVRMVASGGANLFASVAAGICALWGPLHGGANMAVIRMLERIQSEGDDGSKFLDEVKAKKRRLMGFGHRVYKNFDPRSVILRDACKKALEALNVNDPLLDIAMHLEQKALTDEYFVERKLYPNVDFYSGLILQAIGLPLDMFTVIFAMGRIPGWIAHWKEIAEKENQKIHRPRQIYTGSTLRSYVPVEKR